VSYFGNYNGAWFGNWFAYDTLSSTGGLVVMGITARYGIQAGWGVALFDTDVG